MSALFIGAVLIGFAPIFVKLVATSPTATGFYRCAFASIFLGLLLSTKVLARNKAFTPRKWPKQAKGLAVLAGLIFAGDLFVWHRAVIYAGAGMGTILGNTQVFYVSLVGIFFFHEKLTARFLLAVGTALIGVFLLVSYRMKVPDESRYWWGIAFGLSTGIFFSSYLLTLRRIESLSVGIPTEHLMLVVSAVSALGLLPVAIYEQTLRLPLGREWVLLPALALIAQIGGWILITRNLPKVPVSRAGLVLLMQPVVATVVGNIFFGERMTPIQVMGASLTLLAIYLGTLKTTKVVVPAQD